MYKKLGLILTNNCQSNHENKQRKKAVTLDDINLDQIINSINCESKKNLENCKKLRMYNAFKHQQVSEINFELKKDYLHEHPCQEIIQYDKGLFNLHKIQPRRYPCYGLNLDQSIQNLKLKTAPNSDDEHIVIGNSRSIKKQDAFLNPPKPKKKCFDSIDTILTRNKFFLTKEKQQKAEKQGDITNETIIILEKMLQGVNLMAGCNEFIIYKDAMNSYLWTQIRAFQDLSENEGAVKKQLAAMKSFLSYKLPIFDQKKQDAITKLIKFLLKKMLLEKLLDKNPFLKDKDSNLSKASPKKKESPEKKHKTFVIEEVESSEEEAKVKKNNAQATMDTFGGNIDAANIMSIFQLNQRNKEKDQLNSKNDEFKNKLNKVQSRLFTSNTKKNESTDYTKKPESIDYTKNKTSIDFTKRKESIDYAKKKGSIDYTKNKESTDYSTDVKKIHRSRSYQMHSSYTNNNMHSSSIMEDKDSVPHRTSTSFNVRKMSFKKYSALLEKTSNQKFVFQRGIKEQNSKNTNYSGHLVFNPKTREHIYKRFESSQQHNTFQRVKSEQEEFATYMSQKTYKDIQNIKQFGKSYMNLKNTQKKGEEDMSEHNSIKIKLHRPRTNKY